MFELERSKLFVMLKRETGPIHGDVTRNLPRDDLFLHRQQQHCMFVLNTNIDVSIQCSIPFYL